MPNIHNTKHAGAIRGNPLDGLCTRICIEVTKVLDGCVSRFNNQTFVLMLSDIPAEATPPFMYISASNFGEPSFINVTVSPGTGACSRVTGDVVIPVIVTFRDSNCCTFSEQSEVRVHRDILLRIPEPTLIPYQIKTAVALASDIGSFLDDNRVSITACLVIVTKVVVQADVLVPTYGDCVFPNCTSCDGDICRRLLNLPIFPPNPR